MTRAIPSFAPFLRFLAALCVAIAPQVSHASDLAGIYKIMHAVGAAEATAPVPGQSPKGAQHIYLADETVTHSVTAPDDTGLYIHQQPYSLVHLMVSGGGNAARLTVAPGAGVVLAVTGAHNLVAVSAAPNGWVVGQVSGVGNRIQIGQ